MENNKEDAILIAAVGDLALLAMPKGRLIPADWDKADLRLGNCEIVISDQPGQPANKPFRLRAPIDCGKGLSEMGFDAVSLANNHAMDFGLPGLLDTMEHLRAANVAFSGAGRNMTEAGKPVFFDVKGYRVAMLGWCSTIPHGAQATDYCPGLAGVRVISSFMVDTIDLDEEPGAPPWVHTKAVAADLEKFRQAVAETAAQADFTIVSYHWGVPPQYGAFAQGPVMEYQKEIAETAKQAGAGLIIGHHCHAPLGVERIGGLPVLYSLGNYVFHCDYMENGMETTAVIDVDLLNDHLPENEHSCVALIRLVPEEGGLRAEGIRIYPGMLNSQGEGVEPDEATAQDFRQRLIKFSARRKVDLIQQQDGSLLWQL